MTKDKESKKIFIHIPKTGGTSINCDMNGTEWQTTPDFNYRHIIYQTKCSNSADIFDPKINNKYIGFEVFMMLRNPIDRLFSEYYFLRDRAEFFSLLSKKPKSFYEYCLLQNTQNGMIKFLIGKKIYSNIPIFEKHYNLVQNAVDKLPIRVGIFEDYGESLSYFSDCFDCNFSNTIQKKRMTLSKPDHMELSEEQMEEVKRLNKYDFRLYDSSVEKLKTANFSNLEFKFLGEKYDYVLKYTERFVLIEGALQNKIFIKNNREFFVGLNDRLRASNLSGLEYVNGWNEAVLKSVESGLNQRIDSLNDVLSLQGLEQTYGLAKLIDESSQMFNSLEL